jgi:hypothetical protein
LIQEGGKGVCSQALPLVPWKHAWAPFLSNVVLVGAYWWSFFIFNMVPVCPVVTAWPPKPEQSNPMMAKAMKPPDKRKHMQTVLLFPDELQLCMETLCVLLLMA